MFPMNPGFDLARLNALRSLFGGSPPMSGPYPVAGMPPVHGTALPPPSPVGNPPISGPYPIHFMGPPVGAPPAPPAPVAQGTAMAPPGNLFSNLEALRSLAPQFQMRHPLTPMY